MEGKELLHFVRGESVSQRLLQIGDPAPDFTLPTTGGDSIHLYEILKRSPAVLFFFVKAFTPVCTAEACGFRDQKIDFDQAGSLVFGLSGDSPAAAGRFKRLFDLPFPLLLDSEQRVRKMYGVPRTLGLFPGRATFVIGQDGIVRQAVRGTFQAKRHIRKSLEALHAEV